MPAILAWQPNETSSLVLRHLAAGGCVALPTESTYEIVTSALNPDSAARLQNLGTPSVIVFDQPQLLDWLPQLRGAAVRLFRKMGAGPIILESEAGFSSGLWSRLPGAVRCSLVSEERLSIRWPSHPIWSELHAADMPLISVPVPGAHSAEETARLVGEGVAITADAGPTQYGSLPSVVRAEGRRCQLRQEGAMPADLLDELTQCRILFICTGNTCRSPMAAGLCARLLADRLGCTPRELNRHGFCVQSAGLSAMIGGAATPDAVGVAAELGADISQHRSDRVNLDMLLWADYVFAMTAGHWYALKSIPAGEWPEPRLLSPRNEDVDDPIGGELADYRSCANQIIECLQQRLPELLES
jgi:protein-tyrosine-phosphatase/tRNA A37 threonylcarbamoyladenosine synthetase subunit TsaC/SUA5/YrdC